MSTFELDLKRFAEKTGAKANAAVGAIVMQLSAAVDRRSPVGDARYWKSPPPKGYIGGHFRGNWQLGISTAPAGEIAGVDPSGSRAQGAIKANLPADAAGKVFWIVNNAPYAQALEDGHSPQAAPGGIVSVTMTEVQAIVKRVVAELPQ
jgi:hypothetical protein